MSSDRFGVIATAQWNPWWFRSKGLPSGSRDTGSTEDATPRACAEDAPEPALRRRKGATRSLRSRLRGGRSVGYLFEVPDRSAVVGEAYVRSDVSSTRLGTVEKNSVQIAEPSSQV